MVASIRAVSYRLPTKADRASAQYRRSKPRAEVVFEPEAGEDLSFSVPPRVARAFAKTDIVFPASYEFLRDELMRVDARECFAALVEALSRRDYGVAEISEKLRLMGFRSRSIEAAVERAREARYLDDARYLRQFIEERKRRGWGRRKIELELKRRGEDPYTLDDYPGAYFSQDEDLERARGLLARKTVPDARAFEKLTRFLMAKGFSYSVASSAVKERLGE